METEMESQKRREKEKNQFYFYLSMKTCRTLRGKAACCEQQSEWNKKKRIQLKCKFNNYLNIFAMNFRADNVGTNKNGVQISTFTLFVLCSVLGGSVGWLKQKENGCTTKNIQLELLSIKEGHAFGIFIRFSFIFSFSRRKKTLLFSIYFLVSLPKWFSYENVCKINGISFVSSARKKLFTENVSSSVICRQLWSRKCIKHLRFQKVPDFLIL